MPSQAFIQAHTGLTELPLLATLQVIRGYADHDDTVTIDQPRQYTLQAQEDAYVFNLREPYWTEACDRYYGDAPDDEPNHEQIERAHV